MNKCAKKLHCNKYKKNKNTVSSKTEIILLKYDLFLLNLQLPYLVQRYFVFQYLGTKNEVWLPSHHSLLLDFC